MTAVEAVVFDLDGTLADTPQAIATAMVQVLAGLGVQPDESAVRATIGRPLEESFAGLLGVAADDPRVAEAAARYQGLFRSAVAARGAGLGYPGVPEGIAALFARGLRLAVATSKPQRAAARVLEAIGIAGYFATVAGHDCVAHGKPDPETALLVAERLGLEPAACLVAGDGPADVAMALAAGMRVAGVSYGVATAAELRAAGAEEVLDTFPQLIDFIIRMQEKEKEKSA